MYKNKLQIVQMFSNDNIWMELQIHNSESISIFETTILRVISHSAMAVWNVIILIESNYLLDSNNTVVSGNTAQTKTNVMPL